MEEKLGRNDPCPCGSGKKYKKCCYGAPSKPKFTAKVIKSGNQPPTENVPDLMARFLKDKEGKEFEMTQKDYRVTAD